VHPKLITVAAHCVDEGTPVDVFFGDTRDQDGPGRVVDIESCHVRGGQQAGEDFAYCILEEEVTDVSIIPILYGCELDLLQEDARAMLVGFGNIDEDTPPPMGHKRWVEAPIVKIEEKTIDVGEPGASNCFGDSGGPAYFQMPDGSWRVFGTTSTSYVVDGVACANEALCRPDPTKSRATARAACPTDAVPREAKRWPCAGFSLRRWLDDDAGASGRSPL
jgi:hypothetical protein